MLVRNQIGQLLRQSVEDVDIDEFLTGNFRAS